MRRRQLLLAAAGAVAGACTASVAASPAQSVTTVVTPLSGNPSRGILPAFLMQADARVREAYAYAVDHPNELRYIACYCGCAGAGHADNADCFVRSRGDGGWVTFEPHGSVCGTCVGIALDAKAMLGRGMSLREARAAIDARWSSAGPGTRTPLPD